jgi:hypothetical protein
LLGYWANADVAASASAATTVLFIKRLLLV